MNTNKNEIFNMFIKKDDVTMLLLIIYFNTLPNVSYYYFTILARLFLFHTLSFISNLVRLGIGRKRFERFFFCFFMMQPNLDNHTSYFALW